MLVKMLSQVTGFRSAWTANAGTAVDLSWMAEAREGDERMGKGLLVVVIVIIVIALAYMFLFRGRRM
jgi:hypothetical protein